MSGPSRSAAVTTAARVSVSEWGELKAEKRLPGVLRVLVDGQHVGAFQRVWSFQRVGTAWRAIHQANVTSRPRQTEHEDAQAAFQAVLRSGFARHLGARVASYVSWTERARRLAGIRS